MLLVSAYTGNLDLIPPRSFGRDPPSIWNVVFFAPPGEIYIPFFDFSNVNFTERKHRHIKERFSRGIVNTLPYRSTKQLESWLLSSLVSNINHVPTWYIFDYVSPREKLLGRRTNVDKELKHGFGDYVQVHTSIIYTRL